MATAALLFISLINFVKALDVPKLAIGFVGEGNELVDLCKGLMVELTVFFFGLGSEAMRRI